MTKSAHPEARASESSEPIKHKTGDLVKRRPAPSYLWPFLHRERTPMLRNRQREADAHKPSFEPEEVVRRALKPPAERRVVDLDGDHRNSPLSIVEIPHPVSVGPAV